MKLRIRENTIRLRLKRGEVDQIASGENIVEETHFPGSVLTYRLEVTGNSEFSASFDGGNLTICVPGAQVTEWARSEQVSIVAEQDLGESGALSVLIEKDFECLSPGHHRLGDDDADTFPHPEAGSGTGC